MYNKQQQQQQNEALISKKSKRNSKCEEHTGEPLTNFCSNLNCLKPLCPDCINSHTRLHLSQNSTPDINSIKNVKFHCGKKLKAAITSLNNEIAKCELQYLFNPESIIEEEKTKIRKCKERVLQSVNNFFDALEESVKRRVQENMLKAGDFSNVFHKMRNLINELQFLNQDLEVGNVIDNIRKICLLDLKKVMDKFKSDIYKVIYF